MTLYLLARTHARAEFATADAINDAGGFAVVPRERYTPPSGNGKPADPQDRPLLPRLIFMACTEADWHRFQTKRLRCDGKILPPIHREYDLTPRHWADCQAFIAHAEAEYQHRLEREAQGKKLRNMRKGDKVRIIKASTLDGQLSDKLGMFVGVNKAGELLVQTDVLMMGKQVVARLQPGEVMGVAAE